MHSQPKCFIPENLFPTCDSELPTYNLELQTTPTKGPSEPY